MQCNSGAVCREPARGAELMEGVTEGGGSEGVRESSAGESEVRSC